MDPERNVNTQGVECNLFIFLHKIIEFSFKLNTVAMYFQKKIHAIHMQIVVYTPTHTHFTCVVWTLENKSVA